MAAPYTGHHHEFLDTCTAYRWQVRMECAPPYWGSDWSVADTFTTVCATPKTHLEESASGSELTLRLQPTPANNWLLVAWPTPLTDQVTLALYNAQGQLLLNRSTAGSRSRFRINTSELPAGVYHLVARNRSTVLHHKVIIQH